MGIYKIFLKLMSRRLLSHLIAPLIFGVGFEILIAWGIAWYHGSTISLREYLISPERFGLYGGILVTYLIIAGVNVHREARSPWQKEETERLDRTLKDATSFFATCTIPLKEWFEPYMQQYFSQMVKHQLANQDFRQERVLLFFKDSQLADAKTQYIDGLYARPLCMIHQNYGIKLGYLKPAEIEAILTELKCSNYDFAFVTRKNPPLETVLLFEKKGQLLKLKRLVKEDEIKPYRDLMEAIKATASEHGTSPGQLELNEDHDFCAAVTSG